MEQKNKYKYKIIHLWKRIVNSLRWLRPGLGVKRWVGVILLGMTLLAMGFALLVLDFYRTAPETWWLPLLSFASLRILPRLLRVLIFGGIGLAIISWGIYALNRSLLLPFRQPGRPVVSALEDHRRRKSGPRVVVIGGGHGLSTLLRGLKAYTHNLYAIVTVADDGGSSGRLRQTMGILPPGDIRNCLAALSNDEALMEQLFQYRFANGGGELDGHSFGNLFITALSAITGSFEDAIAESGRVLAVRGRVYPASLKDVRLVADIIQPHTAKEIRVKGESRISEVKGRIKRVWLEPNNPPAFPKVVQSILAADLIIIGPGSLYTSILPNLLVPDINAALRANQGFKVYVNNVATQPGETEGFSCEDHVMVLDQHIGRGFCDLVVCNNNFDGELLGDMEWVKTGPDSNLGYPTYMIDLIDMNEPWHHDSQKLASVLMNLYQARTGPLAE
ncbi:MAG: YvcK family protein [Chloroflexota bacterium]|nr:YvcK family protein [Chloroflexota bacterium]